MFDDYIYTFLLKKNKQMSMITQLYCNDIKLDIKYFHIFVPTKKIPKI